MAQLLDRKSPTSTDLTPDERGSGRNQAIAPEDSLLKYGRIASQDAFAPTLKELQDTYARVGGKITCNTQNPFKHKMEMPGKTVWGSRAALWNWYYDRREMMALVAAARPLPF